MCQVSFGGRCSRIKKITTEIYKLKNDLRTTLGPDRWTDRRTSRRAVTAQRLQYPLCPMGQRY